MLIKAVLNCAVIVLCISSIACTMDNKPIDNENKNTNNTFVTIDNNFAHQVSNAFSKSLEIKNVVSELIINNNKSRDHSITLNDSIIVQLKNANNKLQNQLGSLAKDFEALKHNYDIEVTSKKYRKDLKELYKNQICTPSNEIFNISSNKNENNNIKNASIFFNKNTNKLLAAGFNNINTINNDDIYISDLAITTAIHNQQNIFFNKIDDKLQATIKVEDYLNKLIERLPDWDPKNKKVREDIMWLIDNDCKNIKRQLRTYKRLQGKMNISENLKNIGKYVNEIKVEIEQIKEKIDTNIYKDKDEELYSALEEFSKNYNNLLENHEFFKNLQNEIQYDNNLEAVMRSKNLTKQSSSKSNKQNKESTKFKFSSHVVSSNNVKCITKTRTTSIDKEITNVTKMIHNKIIIVGILMQRDLIFQLL